MNRNLAKKTHSKKTRLFSRQNVIIFSCVTTVFIALSVSGYIYYKQSKANNLIASYQTQINSWISERKKNLNQGIVKVKHLAKKKPDDADIHFEFYTALPNMQVNLHDFNTPDENKIEKVKITKTKKLAMNSAISNAAELEAQLSAQITKHKLKTSSQHSKGLN